MKKFFLISLLIVAGLLLAACAQPATEAPAEEEIAEAPEEAPPEEAVVRKLRLAHAFPINVDPGIGADYASNTALSNIYDTLVFPTPDGDFIPWVAESWEISDGGLTYTFHLRDDVEFHDGSTLDASDVAFSMNRYLTMGQGNGYLFTTRVTDVEVIDDNTVAITIGTPYALFMQTLFRLHIVNEDQVMANLGEGDFGDFGDYGTVWFQDHDAGSGPYQVKEFRKGEFLLLEKFEDWWAKDQAVPNAPDEVRFIPGPAPAVLQTLMANRELEISDQWQGADALRAADEIEGVDVATFDALTMLYLYLNTTIPPLDDINVRRAVAYAFDYETAAELDWPGTQPGTGPVTAGMPGFNANLTPYVLDLDKAREELALSKYADTIGDFPVTFRWITEVPDEEKIALLFQSNMAELGITVDIIGTPWLNAIELFAEKDTSPMVVPLYVDSDQPEAGAALFRRYHSSTTGSFFQGEWLLDETLDANLEDALQTLDRDARFAKYAELQEYIYDLSPSIFAFDQFQKHAYQTYIDWPATEGIVYPVMGYNQFFPFIGVNSP